MSSEKVVLLIENSRTFQHYYAAQLQPLGYRTVTATSLESTLFQLEHEPVSIALVAMDLGPEVTSIVDTLLTKGIGIILLSDLEDAQLRHHLIENEIIDYVAKQSPGGKCEATALIQRLENNVNTTILIIDDSSFFRHVMSASLQRHRFQTLEAANGIEALEFLEHHTIDMIITDFEMPRMNGIELIRNVRNDPGHTSIPIILVSSNEATETIVDALKSGANDYLHKPFSSAELYTRVYHILNEVAHLKALDEQKQIYETLFYKASNGIILLEAGHIVDCNDASVIMAKAASKEILIGRTLFDFLPEYQPDGVKSMKRLMHYLKKQITRFELQFLQLDGTPIWVELLHAPLTLSNRQVNHITLHDITEMKYLKNELEALNSFLEKRVAQEVEKNREQSSFMLQQSRLAQMGEMLSMIAHQWRQPLASITAITGALTIDVLTGSYKEETFEAQLGNITELAQHLSSTINDFRDFFRAHKERVSVTLSDVIQGSLQIIGPSLEGKAIILQVTIEDNVTIQTYANELKQVLLNILKNAEDALLDKKPQHPRIDIRGRREDGYAIIEIEDNGGGIPESIVGSIFDPYFSTKESRDGTGLGLYMSKTIIDEHCQGKLNVSDGTYGACFRIALPVDIASLKN